MEPQFPWQLWSMLQAIVQFEPVKFDAKHFEQIGEAEAHAATLLHRLG